MSYLALYRKYRPTKFEDLIGQEHVVKTLVHQIESGRVGHAYLFTGTRGTGKTTAAKIFARAINCEHPINGSPCGECATCKALADPSNIDIIEMDAASNNGVNEIRDLRENVQFPPVNAKHKVYIIDEVHMLSTSAFNALLKTLEEPPEHAVFILATTEVHKIPATILSRCMRFDFKLIPTEKIAELIAKIYDEQGKKYEKEAIMALAKAGEGSVRDALSVADVAISSVSEVLKYEDVTDILGTSNFDVLADFVSSMLQGRAGDVLDTIGKMASLGKSMGILIKDVMSMLRDVLVVKTSKDANKILSLPQNEMQTLKGLALNASEARFLRALEIFAEAEGVLKYSTRQRIVFETAAIKATRPDTDYDFDALLARIKALEDKINGSGGGSEAVIVQPPREQEPPKKAVEEAKEKISVVEKAFYSFSDFTESNLKGRLLTSLRKTGSEMLSILLQNVDVKASGKTLYLIPTNASDKAILEKQSSMESIKRALGDFIPFEISVRESEKTKNADAVDAASEKMRKIFGDDIVIIR